MADKFTERRRSEIMSSIRSKDTQPEIAVRRTLYRMGYRFRLHPKGLPGKPDVVLPKYRTVVLVHGCFWHGCRMCDRGMRVPKTNREFWVAKVAENCRRDKRVAHALEEAGWQVIVIWACETNNLERLESLIAGRLSMPSAQPDQKKVGQ